MHSVSLCFQLVVSSDKLASVQEPLLSVDLDIDAAGEDETKFASVEMNKADLQKMITSLEAANKVLVMIVNSIGFLCYQLKKLWQMNIMLLFCLVVLMLYVIQDNKMSFHIIIRA